MKDSKRGTHGTPKVRSRLIILRCDDQEINTVSGSHKSS